ncbi:hypothetical protein ABC347_04945 [Sphingomonas sp. 1P06PA]|uniref:hypothetical protein n=1 Tax=Sphingomonas sp. 1P06PA TaxID=554121 RepID=UPI0039A66898
MRIILAMVAAGLLSGCVSTAVDVVTLPVRAVGQGVDWATTSQDEADRNRGRKLRKQEAREAKERRREEKRRRKQEREWRDD